jgi:hypothetical protein
MFARGSRYEQTPEGVHVDAAGRSHPYKLLRELPADVPGVHVHRLGDGERLDLLAQRFHGDAEHFWRICDANRALRPQDLEVPGTVLRLAVVVW